MGRKANPTRIKRKFTDDINLSVSSSGAPAYSIENDGIHIYSPGKDIVWQVHDDNIVERGEWSFRYDEYGGGMCFDDSYCWRVKVTLDELMALLPQPAPGGGEGVGMAKQDRRGPHVLS